MDNIEKNLSKILKKKGLKADSIEGCDVILVFCPIVSRAGTDIGTVLEQLNNTKVTKPTIVVVLHHTYDPQKIVPDSCKTVNRENTLAVDCLFHEDTGLLECQKNTDAIDKIANYLKSKKSTSYAFLKKEHVSSNAFSDQGAEERPLISYGGGSDPEQNQRGEDSLNGLRCRLCCCCS